MSNKRFGKHPPKVDYRTLRFKNYLPAKGITPKPTFNVLTEVYANLKTTNAATLFPMDGNDKYGDCTCAALAHAITVYRGLVKKKNIWPQANVLKLYFQLTGGADTGLNELDVLNYWQSNAVDGDKILAYTAIDVKNIDHVKLAIELFGGVYLGFQVQENCIQEFDNKTPWTPGPLTNDGHAVFAVAYDANTVTVLTWGSTQQGTWAWWTECVDEAYAILPPEAEQPDFAPGFNFAQLKADLQDVAGAQSS